MRCGVMLCSALYLRAEAGMELSAPEALFTHTHSHTHSAEHAGDEGPKQPGSLTEAGT